MSRPNRLLATFPVMYAAKALAASSALQASPRYDSISANAADMNTPWAMRRAGNAVRSGATASSAVGTASSTRLVKIPSRRSSCRLNSATPRPATAMPIVLAFTAKPMAAGVTPYAWASDGRIACVANRSTTVRNAASPITSVRMSAPLAPGYPACSEGAKASWLVVVMAGAGRLVPETKPGFRLGYEDQVRD